MKKSSSPEQSRSVPRPASAETFISEHEIIEMLHKLNSEKVGLICCLDECTDRLLIHSWFFCNCPILLIRAMYLLYSATGQSGE